MPGILRLRKRTAPDMYFPRLGVRDATDGEEAVDVLLELLDAPPDIHEHVPPDMPSGKALVDMVTRLVETAEAVKGFVNGLGYVLTPGEDKEPSKYDLEDVFEAHEEYMAAVKGWIGEIRDAVDEVRRKRLLDEIDAREVVR